MTEESDPGSITGWIEALKQGHPDAADALWQHYFERVVRLARRRLGVAPHQAVEDAEDAAASAFHVLCEGAARGRFDRLNDRVDLWRLLTAITVKKVLGQRQRHGRLKRGGGRLIAGAAAADRPGPDQGPGARDDEGADHPEHALAEALSKEPTPEAAALIDEQYRALLAALEDKTLEQIAVWRMEGLSNEEIAHQLKCAVRTVERKLERIRAIWTEYGLEP
jgi:RNA polymerase sigma factor (sigma-70 family)